MINRRGLFAGGTLAWLGAGYGVGAAQPAGSTDNPLARFGFIGPAQDPDFGPLITGAPPPPAALVGGQAARHEEVVTAFRLIFKTPFGTDQLNVARYFEGVREKNQDQEPYNFEWKVRANPLIVGLFSMTNTLPAQGDQTAWCAAFVNFCLYAAGKKGTFSALSGSFRKYGDPTTSPKPGDIVVFQKTGDEGTKGFGHVGFFLARSGDNISILGGNQRGQTGSTGAVVTATYPRESADLFLHSYRSV